MSGAPYGGVEQQAQIARLGKFRLLGTEQQLKTEERVGGGNVAADFLVERTGGGVGGARLGHAAQRPLGVADASPRRGFRAFVARDLEAKARLGVEAARVFPAAAILCGGGARTLGFLKYATTNFHGEVVYGNPFGKTEAPAFLTPVLEISGPEFSVAVGLALRQFL